MPSVASSRALAKTLRSESELGGHDYIPLLISKWQTQKSYQGRRFAEKGPGLPVQLCETPSWWKASVRYQDRTNMAEGEWKVTWGEGSTVKAAQRTCYHACTELGLI